MTRRALALVGLQSRTDVGNGDEKAEMEDSENEVNSSPGGRLR